MPNSWSITYVEISVHVLWLRDVNICKKEFNGNTTIGSFS